MKIVSSNILKKEIIMKKILLLVSLLVLNACSGFEGEDGNYVSQKVSKIVFNYKEMPKSFSLEVENFNGDYLQYGLLNSHKEVIFQREVSKGDKETMICQTYSNEITFVAYDCIINSRFNGNRSQNLIIKKSIIYTLYSIGEDRDKANFGEIFIK